jgi:hypothetical protein
MNIIKYIPELKKHSQKKDFEKIWEEVYNQRKIKVGKKKAIYSANAKIKSLLVKEENLLIKQIKENWNKEYIIEKKEDYSVYEIDDMNVIITTKKEVLKDYKEVKRKGLIKYVEDNYEIKILDKLKDVNKIKLHPDLYYVMWSK